MGDDSGDRSQHFSAIEAKHGHGVPHWLDSLTRLASDKYDDQIAYLRDQHGFSRTHANALVMYHRSTP